MVSQKLQKIVTLGFFTSLPPCPQINCLRVTGSQMIKNARSELVMMVQTAMMMLNHLPCIACAGLFVHEVLASPNKINS